MLHISLLVTATKQSKRNSVWFTSATLISMYEESTCTILNRGVNCSREFVLHERSYVRFGVLYLSKSKTRRKDSFSLLSELPLSKK